LALFYFEKLSLPMEVKVSCACGTRFKFDVEPHLGRMPQRVKCPDCGADGTDAANAYIATQTASTPSTAPVAPVAFTMISPPSGATAASAVVATPPPPPAAASSIRFASTSTPPDATPARAQRTLLDRSIFFVKERVAVLKLTDTYDILDPASGQQIGIAKEEPPTWAKWLRLAVNKQMLPTSVNIYENEGQPPLVSIHRGFTILRSKIKVIGAGRKPLGYFTSKLFSIGGGFNVFDNANKQVAQVKGNWKGWDFKFLNNGGREIGLVTKKWAGLGKELFSTADNYIISVSDASAAHPDIIALLLAAGLSIDIVLKEGK
jgi:uncharacterized protein YxjI